MLPSTESIITAFHYDVLNQAFPTLSVQLSSALQPVHHCRPPIGLEVRDSSPRSLRSRSLVSNIGMSRAFMEMAYVTPGPSAPQAVPARPQEIPAWHQHLSAAIISDNSSSGTIWEGQPWSNLHQSAASEWVAAHWGYSMALVG